MAEGDALRIRVQQDTYTLDFEQLQWGELEEMERLMDCPLEDARWDSARGVLTLAYIAVRKDKPAVTLDSLRALPMSEIELVDEPDPTLAVEDGEGEVSGPQP